MAGKKTGSLGPNQYRCMKCKENVTVAESATTTRRTKNGRNIRQGKCPKCGTVVGKFVKG